MNIFIKKFVINSSYDFLLLDINIKNCTPLRLYALWANVRASVNTCNMYANTSGSYSYRASNAVYDANCLRMRPSRRINSPPVGPEAFTSRSTSSDVYTLDIFHNRKKDPCRIEYLIAGSKNNCTDFNFFNFFFLFKVYRFPIAYFYTSFLASAGFKFNTGFPIDHNNLRSCLREWNVDWFRLLSPTLKFVGCFAFFINAFLDAIHTTDT